MRDEGCLFLAKVRFENAVEALNAARICNDLQIYKTAANRSYYAVFYAMRALGALEGKDFKKHSGVIGNFQKEYIKTGIFEKSLSNIVSNLFDVRTACDYQDMYIISKEDVREQIENATFFLAEIQKYLAKQGVFGD